MLLWRDLITDLFDALRQFVPINRRAVTNRVIHFARLQGFPTAFGFIKCGIEHREMRVQLRVQRATARVRERGGDQIAGGSVALVALLADSGCGESLEFTEGDARCLSMCRNQSLIVQRHRQEGYGLWSRAGEIEEHTALILRVLSLRQPLAGLRISVFAERMELFAGDVLLQSQPLCARADPLAGPDFAGGVVIVLGQVLDKVTFGTGQTLMRDGSKHSF